MVSYERGTQVGFRVNKDVPGLPQHVKVDQIMMMAFAFQAISGLCAISLEALAFAFGFQTISGHRAISLEPLAFAFYFRSFRPLGHWPRT